MDQLHFGGGTPTFFEPEALRQLGDLIHEKFDFTADAELSVEIDPRCATSEQGRVLREMGINRASLGLQDTNPQVQEAIHRILPQETNLAVVWNLRASGIQSLSLDLIYGLPMQTAASVERTLDDAMALEPERLPVFSVMRMCPGSSRRRKYLSGVVRCLHRKRSWRCLVEFGSDSYAKGMLTLDSITSHDRMTNWLRR
ncbi:MAG: radical SAM protein [Candidatus Synoicihabitans palmerolidicus]|nr:radical SAM protein [Candidatus Synoicihabitans palmerolidicus]